MNVLFNFGRLSLICRGSVLILRFDFLEFLVSLIEIFCFEDKRVLVVIDLYIWMDWLNDIIWLLVYLNVSFLIVILVFMLELEFESEVLIFFKFVCRRILDVKFGDCFLKCFCVVLVIFVSFFKNWSDRFFIMSLRFSVGLEFDLDGVVLLVLDVCIVFSRWFIIMVKRNLIEVLNCIFIGFRIILIDGLRGGCLVGVLEMGDEGFRGLGEWIENVFGRFGVVFVRLGVVMCRCLWFDGR